MQHAMIQSDNNNVNVAMVQVQNVFVQPPRLWKVKVLCNPGQYYSLAHYKSTKKQSVIYHTVVRHT